MPALSLADEITIFAVSGHFPHSLALPHSPMLSVDALHSCMCFAHSPGPLFHALSLSCAVSAQSALHSLHLVPSLDKAS